MKKMVAVRNLDLCTKDCLCLYVCPYGATDTENSIIDTSKCDGCGLCAMACPSKAISMVPIDYPPQQKKNEKVVAVLNNLSKNKALQEQTSYNIANNTTNENLKKLMFAFAKSNRLMAEDTIRESGYMLPQSKNAHEFLNKLLDQDKLEGLPKDLIKELLKRIEVNEK